MSFIVIQDNVTPKDGILIDSTNQGFLRVTSIENKFDSFEISDSSLTPEDIKYPSEVVNHILMMYGKMMFPIRETVYVKETASILIYNICERNRIFF